MSPIIRGSASIPEVLGGLGQDLGDDFRPGDQWCMVDFVDTGASDSESPGKSPRTAAMIINVRLVMFDHTLTLNRTRSKPSWAVRG
jgi:hypothetical protein